MAIEFIKIPAYYFDHAHASLSDINALLLQTLDPETKEPLSIIRPHIIYTSPLRRAVGAIDSVYEIVPELREFVFEVPEQGPEKIQNMSTLVRKIFFAEICQPSRKAYRQNLATVVTNLLARHPEQEITATVLSHTFTLTCIKEILRDRGRFINEPERVFEGYDPEKKLMGFGKSFVEDS
jgi:hypothetical protein